MNPQRVFNPRKRWLLRKQLPGPEVLSGVLVLGLLALVLGWVLAQRDAYDPVERDLPYAMLSEAPVKDELYHPPLVRWHEPGQAPAANAAAVAGGLAPFPGGVAADGWLVDGRLRSFTADTLYEKINGEAEKFIRQGFRGLYVLDFKSRDEKHTLSVELFDQGTLAGSLGIFSGHNTRGARVNQQAGVLYFPTGAGAIGMKENWFFRMAGNSGAAPVLAQARHLVAALKALPGEPAGRDPLFTLFTGMLGLGPAELAFQKQNVFQYDFASDFWFAQVPGSSARWFAHRAANSAAAQKLFQAIAAEHALDYTVSSQGPEQVRMIHPFLKTHFAMAWRDNLVYGLEQEPKVERLNPAMSRLEKALDQAIGRGLFSHEPKPRAPNG